MQYRAAEPRHVQKAELVARDGDPDRAYQQIRQTLIANPADVSAWLAMSSLVDDLVRAQECLDRVLALDPHNQAARDGLERLRLKKLLASVQAPVLQDRRAAARQLGDQLVAQALISADQLRDALREQRRRRNRGEFIALGDLLLDWRCITPQNLARALIVQLQEQTACNPDQAPWFLGQHLIVERVITPLQLEAALEEQIRLRLAGKRVALGQLLIRKGYLSKRTLQRVLDDQRAAFNSRMGD